MNEEKYTIGQRIKRTVILTVKKAMDPYFAGSAAEIAFFLLMSIVPTILLLAQILNLFDLSMDIITGLVEEYASEDLASIVMPLLDYKSSGTLSVALVILALWAGSKAIFSLMRITNYAYLGGTPGKNPLTGYIKERVRAMLTVFIIVFTLIFAIAIVIYGKVIVDAILTYLNGYLGESYRIDDVWFDVSWVLAFVLYFFMVASIYYLLPSSGNRYMQLISKDHIWKSIKRVVGAWTTNAKKTLRIIFPGSIFAAIGMMIATWFYSLYLGNISSSNFNLLYGSLGAAVLLLLWFYILAYVLVLGIQLNSIWSDSKHPEGKSDKYKGNPKDE